MQWIVSIAYLMLFTQHGVNSIRITNILRSQVAPAWRIVGRSLTSVCSTSSRASPHHTIGLQRVRVAPLFNKTPSSSGLDISELNKGNFEEKLWNEFSYGSFNAQTPPSHKQEAIAKLVDEVSVPKDTMDPEWSFLTDEEVNLGIEKLTKYVTEERMKKMTRVLDSRTDNVRVVFENPANPNNCWAALRTFDTFGVQYCGLIMDREKYHNKQRKASMVSALGAQKWMSLKSHRDTKTCLSELKKEGYRIAVTDIHHPDARPLQEIDWNDSKTVIVLGNEKDGVTSDAREMADVHFYLPMKGFAESLNVSAFCAVMMAVLQERGCLEPHLEHTQRQRIFLTWLARTVPNAPAHLRAAGMTLPTDRLYENIAGFTTKPT